MSTTASAGLDALVAIALLATLVSACTAAPAADPSAVETSATTGAPASGPSTDIATGASDPDATVPGVATTSPPRETPDVPREGGWRPLGEPGVGGWVTALEVDPRDPRRVFVGGDLLGAGVSTDGGDSWMPGLDLASYEIADLVVTADGTAWAATLGGPHRSDDGGRTWTVARAGLPAPATDTFAAPISRIVESPARPGRLLAFGGVATVWPDRAADELGTVWESTDAGATWVRRAEVVGGANVIAAASLPPSLGGGFVALVEGIGLFVADDDAVDWSPLDTPLPASALSAVGVADDGTMWVTAGGFAEVASSADRGTTWRTSGEGLADATGSGLGALAVGAGPRPTLVVSDVGFTAPAVYLSTDLGTTWTKVLDRASQPDTAFPTAPVMTVLEVDPTDPDRIFAAGSEYVLRSDDAGRSWRDVTSTTETSGRFTGTGFSGIVASGVHVNPFDPTQVALTGLDAANLVLSDDGGATWRTQCFPDWDPWGGAYGAAFADGSTLFVLAGQAGEFGGVGRSTDAGATFTFAAGPMAGLPDRGARTDATTAAIEAIDASTVLVTFDGRLSRSVDGGVTWATIDAPAGAGDLERSPTAPGTVVLAADDGLHTSSDGGSTFTEMPGSPGGLTNLAFAPDGTTIFGTRWRMGSDDGLWRFDGRTWQLVLAERLARDVAVDPFDPRRVVLTTEEHPFRDGSTGAGVFLSIDGGTTWTAFNDGLAMLRGGAVAFDLTVPGRVYLGTEGGGFWVADL